MDMFLERRVCKCCCWAPSTARHFDGRPSVSNEHEVAVARVGQSLSSRVRTLCYEFNGAFQIGWCLAWLAYHPIPYCHRLVPALLRIGQILRLALAWNQSIVHTRLRLPSCSSRITLGLRATTAKCLEDLDNVNTIENSRSSNESIFARYKAPCKSSCRGESSRQQRPLLNNSI